MVGSTKCHTAMLGSTKCPCGAARRISGRSSLCARCAVQARRVKPLPPDAKQKAPTWYRGGICRPLADIRAGRKSTETTKNLLTT